MKMQNQLLKNYFKKFLKKEKWNARDGIRIFNIKYNAKDVKKMQDNLVKIMDEAYLTNHSFCRKLEKKLEKIHKKHHFLSCSSGTSALEAIFHYLQIESKAILVQSNTFIATGHAIHASGGIIVPFDLSNDNFTASFFDIKEAYAYCKKIGLDVGAVCVVNIAGRASEDLLKISNFCSEENIPLVEDNAQGMYSKIYDDYLGTIADFSAYSFHTTKIVACGEGGAISCKKLSDYEKIKNFITFGKNPENALLFDNFSGNYKLNELSASFILMDLSRINLRLKRRKEIDRLYKNYLKSSEKIYYLNPPPNNKPSFYKTILNCDSNKTRQKIESIFKTNKISMTGYVYQLPLHHQPRIYKSKYFVERKLPITDKFCSNHITPPNYPELTNEQISFILEKINQI